MSPARKSFWRVTAVSVALILITFLVYFPPYARYFVGDDYIQFDYIKPFVARPLTAIQLLNPYTLEWYYRPTQNLWFLINRLILGYNPVGYYALQLWLHALAVVLVYRTARLLRLSRFAAFAGAALFAIHSHHLDVVTWISSVAIVLEAVFSLAAMSLWLRYLQRPSRRLLLLTGLFWLLALLTHEEGLLLAPFLLLLWLVQRWGEAKRPFTLRRFRQRIQRAEWAALIVVALLSLAYLVAQLTRSNATIDVTTASSGAWLSLLSWSSFSQFWQVTLFRFTFAYPLLNLTGWSLNFFLLIALGLLLMWFWYGGRVVRLGLVWTAVHLAFIYVALWSQKPELYAGRHIYNALIGLVLAVGGGVDWLLRESRRRRKQPTYRQTAVLLGIGVGVLLLHAVIQTRQTQQTWLANVLEEEAARQQLQTLFPSLPPDTHIFSVRFPIAPQFTRAVAQVWYDQPLERPGGSLTHLRTWGKADASFIVLDYEAGQVINLMPELAEAEETIFLWPDTAVAPLAPLADANQEHRLAVPLSPTETNSYTVTVAVPPQSQLAFGVLDVADLRYEVRLNGALLQTHESSGDGLWHDVTLSLNDYTNETVAIQFTVTAEANTDASGAFADPRLIRP